jgi:trehalose 6-phosphate synthase
MGRLIVISNRISLPDQGTPSGGLAVGVLSALRNSSGGTWLGWSGETTDEPSTEPKREEHEQICFATIDLPAAHFSRYYDGFCNSTLWPLHHYFTEAFRYDPLEYESYLQINGCFADAAVKLIQPGDIVWVHDYQLIPLGRMLRERGVRTPVGFFLHIPFPQSEILRLLPNAAELMQDLCQYDLVGFQTIEDSEAFKAALHAQELGVKVAPPQPAGRTPTPEVGVFPIGVDADVIAQEAVEAEASDVQVKRLAASMLGRQMLIGVDRLDYSKGLVERFDAYHALLETHPELQGKVTLVQIAPLSRINVEAYVSIRDSLEQTAGHINGKFADADWTPIRYLNKDFSHATLCGFLRLADVAVVTPLRDGMNLVAKEFVAAQNPDSPGVLVLSNLAGAARELKDGALLVNPYDKAAVAAALKQALAMPLDERRRRLGTMMTKIKENSIGAWHKSFIEHLKMAASRRRLAA